MRALALALAVSAAAAHPRAATKDALHFLVRKSDGPPPDELPEDACTNWFHEGTCYKNDDWGGNDLCRNQPMRGVRDITLH